MLCLDILMLHVPILHSGMALQCTSVAFPAFWHNIGAGRNQQDDDSPLGFWVITWNHAHGSWFIQNVEDSAFMCTLPLWRFPFGRFECHGWWGFNFKSKKWEPPRFYDLPEINDWNQRKWWRRHFTGGAKLLCSLIWKADPPGNDHISHPGESAFGWGDRLVPERVTQKETSNIYKKPPRFSGKQSFKNQSFPHLIFHCDIICLGNISTAHLHLREFDSYKMTIKPWEVWWKTGDFSCFHYSQTIQTHQVAHVKPNS